MYSGRSWGEPSVIAQEEPRTVVVDMDVLARTGVRFGRYVSLAQIF